MLCDLWSTLHTIWLFLKIIYNFMTSGYMLDRERKVTAFGVTVKMVETDFFFFFA